jgi:hypothetical protein
MELMEGKYKELERFVSQKEMLAKVMNCHGTQ